MPNVWAPVDGQRATLGAAGGSRWCDLQPTTGESLHFCSAHRGVRVPVSATISPSLNPMR
eukprot:835899-Prymnesium_polylepis.2